MNTNALAFDLAPPASSEAGFLGKLWNSVTTCENFESFPSLGVCSRLKKLYSLLMERHQDTGRVFDTSLFIVFVLVFFAFLISSSCTVFVEEKKSLKEISNKVRKTTDALISLLRAFWTLKEAKVSNLKMELECRKVNKMKISRYLLDRNLIKKFEGAAIVAFADLNLPVKISQPDIFYTHEEDFPIESDWISLSRSPSEITSLIVSDQLSYSNLRKEMNGQIPGFPNMIIEHSDVVKEKRIMRKRMESLSSIDLSFKNDVNSTALEMIPEAYSDGEDVSLKIKWNNSRNTTQPLKEYQPKQEKLKQHHLTNNLNPAKNSGIFTQRKKILEESKRTKSQTTNLRSESLMRRVDKNYSNLRNAPKETSKKTGIFKRSKHLQRLELK